MELIAVMGIIGLLIAVSAPAISSLARAKGATSAAYQIKDYIDLARNYAISNQTLVRVGITQVSGTATESGRPALVIHAIRNFNPSETGSVETLLATSSVAVNTKDGAGRYEYWDDLARPLILEGVGIINPSQARFNTGLTSQLGNFLAAASSNPNLEDFSRPINGITGGDVSFDLGFVISKQGEFCLEGDIRLDLDGDGGNDVHLHESYPARPFYFGLAELIDDGASGTELETNVSALGLNGLTGRVQIYRKGDLLPGGTSEL